MSFHRIENSAICWARLSRLQLKVMERNKATMAHRHPPTQPIPTFLIRRNSGHCGQNPKFWILRAPADFHPDPPRVRAIKLQCNAILWDSPVHMDCRPVQCSGTTKLVFNAMQGRIPGWIPPIPEAITRGEFDGEGREKEEKLKVGTWKGKSRGKWKWKLLKLLAENLRSRWALDTDISH